LLLYTRAFPILCVTPSSSGPYYRIGGVPVPTVMVGPLQPLYYLTAVAESLYHTSGKRPPRWYGCAAPGFLTRVQLHLRLQGMGHELYRSADFLPVQIYIYTKVTLPLPSASQNGCQIRSHQKLCFGSTRDKPNMTSCHTQREHRSSILISLIMQQRLV